MSTSNEGSKPIYVELNMASFIFWSQSMEDFHRGKGLWDNVDGTASKLDSTDAKKLKECNLNNSKIILLICSTCKQSIAMTIGKAISAKSLWDSFKNIYRR